jgi:hypothetical protein
MTRQAWTRWGFLILLATAGAIAMVAQEGGPTWTEATWTGLAIVLLTAIGVSVVILVAILKGGRALILDAVRPEISAEVRLLEKALSAETEAALEKHNLSKVAHHGVLVSLTDMQGAIDRVCERQDRMAEAVKELAAELHASRKDTQDMREYLIRFKGTLVDKDKGDGKS